MFFLEVSPGPSAAQHSCVFPSCKPTPPPWLRSASPAWFETLAEGTREGDFQLSPVTDNYMAAHSSCQPLLRMETHYENVKGAKQRPEMQELGAPQGCLRGRQGWQTVHPWPKMLPLNHARWSLKKMCVGDIVGGLRQGWAAAALAAFGGEGCSCCIGTFGPRCQRGCACCCRGAHCLPLLGY